MDDLVETCPAIWVEDNVITHDCVKFIGHDDGETYQRHQASDGRMWVTPIPSLVTAMQNRGAIKEDNHIVSTGIKLQRELLARLQKAADERCIGRNLLIRMLIEQGLDRLIPIEQLIRKVDKDEPEEAGNEGGSSAFGRYLSGTGNDSVHPDSTPKSEPGPSGSSTSVPGGSGGFDPEGFGVCLGLSCPTDVPTTTVRPGDLDAADRRMDQHRKEHGGGSFNVVQ